VVGGLVCGATIGGQPVSGRTPVGAYTINCSGGGVTNYAIAYQAGALTITPAPLTIAAANQQMIPHGAVPALTATYSGFVNGETADALTTKPPCRTTATTSSPAGAYPITCAGAVAPNHPIRYVPGTLNVLYRWIGFARPINDPAADRGNPKNDRHHSARPINDPAPEATSPSMFKAGSTVPIKFGLADATGAAVQAGSPPTFSVSPPQPCAVGTVDESESTVTGDTGTTFRWDSKAHQYIYNYKTASTLAGQ